MGYCFYLGGAGGANVSPTITLIVKQCQWKPFFCV